MTYRLKSREPANMGMKGDTAEMIENANYGRVMHFIDKVLAEDGRFCRCRQCRLDAAALALNTLPPHYHLVSPDNKQDKELGSPWILIEMAVRHSMERVLVFPHHDRELGRLKDSKEAEGPIALEM